MLNEISQKVHFLIKGNKNMADVLFVVLWFICSVIIWIIYHKLFNVVYFDLFNGCLKEFIVAGFLGAIIAAIIICYWPIAVVVIALLWIALSKKR